MFQTSHTRNFFHNLVNRMELVIPILLTSEARILETTNLPILAAPLCLDKKFVG